MASLCLSYQKVMIHFVKKNVFTLLLYFWSHWSCLNWCLWFYQCEALFCTISVSLEVATTLPVFMNIIKIYNKSYWISVQGSLVQLYIEVIFILFIVVVLVEFWYWEVDAIYPSINSYWSFDSFFSILLQYSLLLLCLYIAVNIHVTFV